MKRRALHSMALTFDRRLEIDQGKYDDVGLDQVEKLDGLFLDKR